MKHPIFEHFHATGVIPVVEIDSAGNALALAEALLAGGLPVVEVTLRTEAAIASIDQIARGMKDVLVGAGTIICREQAQAAREAGAQFLVSPGMVEEVVLWGQENHIPVLAGAATPTEMVRGIHLGLEVLKFFPSETLGGVAAIKAMSDPFPKLQFIPTGGIRLENLSEYLQTPKILAVGGSWMAKRAMIADGKFDEIKRLASQASTVVHMIRSQETA